ncbi:MAG: CDP-alcohol phosphatidyltransferase family protein, partial [Bradyrhizobium sp.]|nr:CDP-alcohol phosphatidyltransferase family protein [Bradyrhizobium sp.]
MNEFHCVLSPSLFLLFFPILMIIGEQEEGRDQSVSTIDLEMSKKGGAVTAAGNPIRLYSLPNVITALNLVCGNLAIVSAVEDHLTLTAYWILAAAIFDFLDGFVARWLQKYSEIGLQLDSLADMSSFGIAPAIFTYEHVLGGFFFFFFWF